MEKTQQGGPVRSRKSRGRNDNPYIEERTRSGNKKSRRRGDQQREEQERKGASTRRSLSLEVLKGRSSGILYFHNMALEPKTLAHPWFRDGRSYCRINDTGPPRYKGPTCAATVSLAGLSYLKKCPEGILIQCPLRTS
ncbi:hypothetical protein TNCV_1831701 [Trichonephila clavipes]|nr:hypothetical protein TNCV_1831701 [Trichonephila clavipes]